MRIFVENSMPYMRKNNLALLLVGLYWTKQLSLAVIYHRFSYNYLLLIKKTCEKSLLSLTKKLMFLSVAMFTTYFDHPDPIRWRNNRKFRSVQADQTEDILVLHSCWTVQFCPVSEGRCQHLGKTIDCRILHGQYIFQCQNLLVQDLVSRSQKSSACPEKPDTQLLRTWDR